MATPYEARKRLCSSAGSSHELCVLRDRQLYLKMRHLCEDYVLTFNDGTSNLSDSSQAH